VNNASDPIVLNKIKDVITANPGNAQVYLHVGNATVGKKIKTKSQVTISQPFFDALKSIPEISMVSEK
jgi:hypothetical protein